MKQMDEFTIEQAKITKNFLTLMLGTYKNEMSKVRLAEKNDYVEKLEKLKMLFPEILDNTQFSKISLNIN